MPDFNVKAYLSDDAFTLRDVPSSSFPDGKAYTVDAPSAADELLMRRIAQLQEERDQAELANDRVKVAAVALELAELFAKLCDDGSGGLIPFEVKMLGAAHGEMVADGVRPSGIDKLASLVLTNYGVNEGIARLVVRQAEGEARARQESRAETEQTPQPSSKPKGGTKSRRASGGSSTRKAQGATRGPSPSPESTETAAKTA